MALHLEEISRTVTPGAYAVVPLDQAGWHLSDKLDIPANITLMPLPPKSPELNPVENIWQFMRDNWLSNRVFRSYDDIFDALLLRLEQARRPALDHHVDRPAQLGASVLSAGLGIRLSNGRVRRSRKRRRICPLERGQFAIGEKRADLLLSAPSAATLGLPDELDHLRKAQPFHTRVRQVG
jgi:hypothetical protein